MPRHPESTLAAIKQAVDIVALAGDYIHHPLHRVGSKYKVLCPFHDDHNPSLTIDPERQSYKCWSCQEGGDIFDFVQAIERVDFSEALRMLAERAGVPLTDGRAAGPAQQAGPGKAELLAATAWAEAAFRDALAGSAEAREYVAARGIAPEMAGRFGLGYAPDDRDWLLSAARRAGHSTAALLAAGLVARGAEPPHAIRPRFRGRLIFPIRDARGRPVAFGGRILPSAAKKMAELGRDVAKYLNSPETPLFQKRRVLYAADLARPAARSAGWVAVMEGYTDVIAAHQVGLANAVGTLGTALGDEHVLALRGLADRVVLVFDGDEAGQKAADRSLELFLGHAVDVRVLALPAGLDPCDFLLAEGSGPFLEMVDRAVDPLEFAIRRAGARFSLQSAEGSRQAAEWVLAIFGRAPGRPGAGLDLKMAKALDTLARRLGLPLADLRRRLGEIRRDAARLKARPAPPAAPHAPARTHAAPIPPHPAANPAAAPAIHQGDQDMPAPPARTIPIGSLDPVDRELVQLALNEPGAVDLLRARVPAGSLRDPALAAILQACYDLRREGLPASFDRVSSRLDDPAVRSLAAGLLPTIPDAGPVRISEKAQPVAPALRLEHLLGRLAVRDWERRKREILAAMQETDPDAEPSQYQALYRELCTLQQQRPDTKAKHAS